MVASVNVSVSSTGTFRTVMRHTPPETVSPRIGYVIGRLDRALRREIGALVAPFGLTVSKYTALSILRDRHHQQHGERPVPLA